MHKAVREESVNTVLHDKPHNKFSCQDDFGLALSLSSFYRNIFKMWSFFLGFISTVRVKEKEKLRPLMHTLRIHLNSKSRDPYSCIHTFHCFVLLLALMEETLLSDFGLVSHHNSRLPHLHLIGSL